MRLLLLLLFCSLGFVGFSQSSEEEDDEFEFEEYEPLRFPKYAIGISPSSFANFYSGVQISNDFGILPRVNVAVETAYLYHSVYSPYTNGFRLKVGPQLMAFSNEYVAFNVGLNYLHRRTKAQREFTVLYWTENYTEKFEVERIKTINGAEFTISLLTRLSERLRMELGFGIGLGNLSVVNQNSTQVRNDPFNTERTGGFLIEYSSSGPIALGSFNINFSYILIQD